MPSAPKAGDSVRLAKPEDFSFKRARHVAESTPSLWLRDVVETMFLHGGTEPSQSKKDSDFSKSEITDAHCRAPPSKLEEVNPVNSLRKKVTLSRFPPALKQCE